jgi:FkbM family methyltransferase
MAAKLRLAASLAYHFASQIVGGKRRRRLLARSRALDPSGAAPILDLARCTTAAEARAELEALLLRAFPDPVMGPGTALEDAILALGIARVDPRHHPRAQLAQRFAAYLLQARREASPSQLGQDWFVTFALGDRRDAGYFVEFGAADGVSLSNTLRLERDLGWRGIVAEPNPAHHEALRRNRRCAVSEKCVWSRTGERLSFAVVDASPELSTLTSFQAVDDHDRTKARSIEVPTVSLDNLLREHGAPRQIDYMSIDTEGSEAAVLEAFDFSAHDVAVLTVEHNFGPTRDALFRLLSGHGFVRVLEEFSRWDDWYVTSALADELRSPWRRP